MQPRTFKILWSCCTSPELLIPELSDEKQTFLIFKISVKFSNAVLTDKTLMSCNRTLGNFFFFLVSGALLETFMVVFLYRINREQIRYPTMRECVNYDKKQLGLLS